MTADREARASRLTASVDGPAPLGRPPVVLLHGLGSSREDWALQRTALADRWQVIAFDLQGHGSSELPAGPLTVSSMAAEVAASLVRLDAPPAHIVGLSLGAAVSLQLALDEPGRVRSLTLVNGFARLRPRPAGLINGLGRLLLALIGPMDWLGWWVARTLFPRQDQDRLREEAARRIASNSRGSYLRSLAAVVRFDVRGRLGEIGVPTLVLAGAQDPIVPLNAKQQLAANLAGARLEIVKRSGHVTPVDRPEAFNRVLCRFFEEVEGEGN